MKIKGDNMEILITYIIIINIVAYVVYGIDKRKAIKNKWRISENTLLLFSLLGGGIGSFIGMKLHHHKTNKRKFTFLVPFLTILSAVAIYYLDSLINIF